jgi:transketolase N-terminal domain/subunit
MAAKSYKLDIWWALSTERVCRRRARLWTALTITPAAGKMEGLLGWKVIEIDGHDSNKS